MAYRKVCPIMRKSNAVSFPAGKNGWIGEFCKHIRTGMFVYVDPRRDV
jgi:hypothetical protein